MTRTPIWKSIARTLGTEIAEGQYRPGDKLPTEAQLALRFGVNRHTVRHAISHLTETGVIHTRRGAGIYVRHTPTDYPIGRRVRFHQNLKAAGREPGRVVLASETRRANRQEAEALAIDKNALVHTQEGLSLADDRPIAIFRSVYPADFLPDFLDRLNAETSVTAAFSTYGIGDYMRISTRLTAKRATSTQALHLRISEGDPILRTVAIEATPEGKRIQFGKTWFAGDLVTLTLSDTH